MENDNQGQCKLAHSAVNYVCSTCYTGKHFFSGAASAHSADFIHRIVKNWTPTWHMLYNSTKSNHTTWSYNLMFTAKTVNSTEPWSCELRERRATRWWEHNRAVMTELSFCILLVFTIIDHYYYHYVTISTKQTVFVKKMSNGKYFLKINSSKMMATNV